MPHIRVVLILSWREGSPAVCVQGKGLLPEKRLRRPCVPYCGCNYGTRVAAMSQGGQRRKL